MKYAFLIILALIVLRIDMFVGVVERLWNKLPSFNKEEVLNPGDPVTVSTLAINEMKQDAVSQFQLLMTEFNYNPDKGTRDLIIHYVKEHPELLEMNANVLFSQLEKLHSRVVNENAEQPLLINELMNIFKGDKFRVLQQFYVNYLDENPELFFHYYPSSKDPNCIIAKYAWNNDNLVNLELLNSRMSKIQEFTEKISADKLEFSKNCQLVLRVELSKTNQPSESL